ncbi:hypothetical protein CQW23_06031 [Capsicum baccatum]|uniref:Uncharacterized protein n=1 Tax=Capsicum baccatum TaxID=33114 RepID=A0A2G2X2B3_CAPBA|nr:hypothetical protein CQW23_06031 [Capsicum baccatum]
MYLKLTRTQTEFALFAEEFATAACADKQKIAGLGYKPVTHYLIQTHRSTVNTENISAPVSVKRSLPFSDAEGTMVMTTQTEVKPMEYDTKDSNYLAP